MDVESLWRQHDRPQAEDGVRGPAADLDQEQKPAHLRHGGLVRGEGDRPPLGRLGHLDLLDTLEEHHQPDSTQCHDHQPAGRNVLHCRDGNDVGEDD